MAPSDSWYCEHLLLKKLSCRGTIMFPVCKQLSRNVKPLTLTPGVKYRVYVYSQAKSEIGRRSFLRLRGRLENIIFSDKLTKNNLKRRKNFEDFAALFGSRKTIQTRNRRFRSNLLRLRGKRHRQHYRRRSMERRLCSLVLSPDSSPIVPNGG